MNGQRHDHDREFSARIRAALDADLDGIDEFTRRRLAGMRRAALASRPDRDAHAGRSFWVPAGAFAMSAFAAVILVRVPGTPATGADPDAMQDLDLISASEQFDMLENLDFYVWLDSDDQAG